MNPYGIRLGTPALTTRGMKEHDITVVAELIHKGIIYNIGHIYELLIIKFIVIGLNLALDAQKASGPKLVNFKSTLTTDPAFVDRVKALTKEVEDFAEQFYMPEL